MEGEESGINPVAYKTRVGYISDFVFSIGLWAYVLHTHTYM